MNYYKGTLFLHTKNYNSRFLASENVVPAEWNKLNVIKWGSNNFGHEKREHLQIFRFFFVIKGFKKCMKIY